MSKPSKPGSKQKPLIGASKDLATVTMTSVPKTQKMSYRKRPHSSVQPILKLPSESIATLLTAKENPKMLFAIQCCQEHG